jgi:hypothetical protein
MNNQFKKVLRTVSKIVLGLSALGLIGYLGYSGYLSWKSKPRNVVVTNVTDSSFTVSWVTEIPTKGVVYYDSKDSFLPGIFSSFGKFKAYDDRDVSNAQTECVNDFNESVEVGDDFTVDASDFDCTDILVTKKGEYYTHHVTVLDLDSESSYYFRFGDGFWSWKMNDVHVKTVPVLTDVSSPETLYGYVSAAAYDDYGLMKEEDLKDAFVLGSMIAPDGSEVFVSNAVNADGGWSIDKSSFRNSDGEIVNLEGDVEFCIQYFNLDNPTCKTVVVDDGSFNVGTFIIEETLPDYSNLDVESSSNLFNFVWKISAASCLDNNSCSNYADLMEALAASGDSHAQKYVDARGGSGSKEYESHKTELQANVVAKASASYDSSSTGVFTTPDVNKGTTTTYSVIGCAQDAGCTKTVCYEDGTCNYLDGTVPFGKEGCSRPAYCANTEKGDMVIGNTAYSSIDDIPEYYLDYLDIETDFTYLDDKTIAQYKSDLSERQHAICGENDDIWTGFSCVEQQCSPDTSKYIAGITFTCNSEGFWGSAVLDTNESNGVADSSDNCNSGATKVDSLDGVSFHWLCENAEWMIIKPVDNAISKEVYDTLTEDSIVTVEDYEKKIKNIVDALPRDSDTEYRCCRGRLKTEGICFDEKSFLYCLPDIQNYRSGMSDELVALLEEIESATCVRYSIFDSERVPETLLCKDAFVSSSDYTVVGLYQDIYSETERESFFLDDSDINHEFVSFENYIYCSDGKSYPLEESCPPNTSPVSGSEFLEYINNSDDFALGFCSRDQVVLAWKATNNFNCPETMNVNSALLLEESLLEYNNNTGFYEIKDEYISENNDICCRTGENSYYLYSSVPVTSSCASNGTVVEYNENTCGNKSSFNDTQKSDLISQVLGTTDSQVKAVEDDTTDEYKIVVNQSGFWEVAGEQVYLEAGKDNYLSYDINQNGQYDILIDPLYPSTTLDISNYKGYQKISLKEGINIISFDFLSTSDGESFKASELLSQINKNSVNVESITYFEGGKWAGGLRYGGEDYLLGNDFTLMLGRGYLVIANNDVEFSMPGYSVESSVPVNFSSGWNLVGIHGYTQAFTARTLVDSINTIEGLTADNVTWWPTSKGKYEGIQVEDGRTYGLDYPIDPVNGYFVRISEFEPDNSDCKSIIWHYMGDLNGTCGNTENIF